MAEEALPVAIEARELGKSAHKRLDGINGQIARSNDKLDLIDSKVNSILITLAKEQGGDQMSSRFMDSRWKLIAVVATVLTSSLVALLFTLAFRGHS